MDFVDLIEAVENISQILSRNTPSGIGNRNGKGCIRERYNNIYFTVIGCIFESIGEQIEENPFNFFRIDSEIVRTVGGTLH